MEIQDTLRAASVTRWHIVRTKVDQSMAEHSFNVAMISLALMDELEYFGAISDGFYRREYGEVALLALKHDLDEVFYGDTPSVAKKPKIWPPRLTPQNRLAVIVKIADLIEALVFIESNRVDRHGDEVCEDMRINFDTMVNSFESAAIRRSIMNVFRKINDPFNLRPPE